MPALLSRLLTTQSRLPLPRILSVFKRHGHARVLTREANMTIWKRLKDHYHFYIMLAVLGFGGFTLYINTVYGACQLQDTPEGYEPRIWEYEARPMYQIYAKYITAIHPYAEYEVRLAMLDNLTRIETWRREEEYARHLMYERQDYKAWYYIPYTTKWLEFSNHFYQELKLKTPAWFEQKV